MVNVPHALSGSPRAPCIIAQRVARFYAYSTCNCLSSQTLPRDSRSMTLPECLYKEPVTTHLTHDAPGIPYAPRCLTCSLTAPYELVVHNSGKFRCSGHTSLYRDSLNRVVRGIMALYAPVKMVVMVYANG